MPPRQQAWLPIKPKPFSATAVSMVDSQLCSLPSSHLEHYCDRPFSHVPSISWIPRSQAFRQATLALHRSSTNTTTRTEAHASCVTARARTATFVVKDSANRAEMCMIKKSPVRVRVPTILVCQALSMATSSPSLLLTPKPCDGCTAKEKAAFSLYKLLLAAFVAQAAIPAPKRQPHPFIHSVPHSPMYRHAVVHYRIFGILVPRSDSLTLSQHNCT